MKAKFLFLTNNKSLEHQMFLFWVNQTISEHTFKMLVKAPTTPRGVPVL